MLKLLKEHERYIISDYEAEALKRYENTTIHKKIRTGMTVLIRNPS